MIKGFVSHINIINEGEKEAVIVLENQKNYVIPMEMLPRNVEIDDFIIIDNGKVIIDPNSDDLKEQILQSLQEQMK